MSEGMDKFKAIITEAVEMELNTMQFVHAVDCDNCKEESETPCPIREWWIEYKELFKKEGPSYLERFK